MRFQRTATTLLMVTSLTIATIGHAGAAPAATGVTTAEVSSALENTNGPVARAGKSDRVKVEVPATGNAPVSLKGATGTALAISLPNGGGSAKRAAKGATAYVGNADSANAVIPTDQGVQMLTVVKSRKAATAYTYGMNGNRVTLTPEGGAVITNTGGQVIASIPPAWAKDANGKSVPTRFVTDGKSITQQVDHRTPGVAYPVVADPIVIWLMGLTVYCFIAGTYEARNLRGQPWYMWVWGLFLACAPG